MTSELKASNKSVVYSNASTNRLRYADLQLANMHFVVLNTHKVQGQQQKRIHRTTLTQDLQ
jgi:hypothetical protein